MMKGLLLVYPICGAMIGGGNFVSKVLLAAGAGSSTLFSAFSAIAVGAIPVFFVPTVLKQSFAAIGNLGAKISGLGQRASGWSQNKMRNSGIYKNAQETGAQRATRRRSGIDKNGNQVTGARRTFAKLMSGGERNMARYRAQYLKDQDTRNREKNMMGNGYEAARAGLAMKASQQQVSDYEALISSGNVVDSNGKALNVNDIAQLGQSHGNAIAKYHKAQQAKDKAEADAAMVQAKALQNILSKTDAGRGIVDGNLKNATTQGYTAGLQELASSALSGYGDTYKSKNRGEHAMMQDMAVANSGTDFSNIADKVKSGEYERAGTSKYTPEDLPEADTAALEGLVKQIQSGNMSSTELNNIQATAFGTLENEKKGTVNIKPEAKTLIEQLAAGYTPPAVTSQIISHGAYEDERGNVVHLRQMDNGKYLDDGGFEVDITHYKSR